VAEPEDLILEGAHFATRVARHAWRKYGPATDPHVVTLASVRQRLELFLGALFGGDFRIVAAEPPAPSSWLATLAHRRPRHLRNTILTPATDGVRIHLPPTLPRGADDDRALCTYRLLAVEQAARVVRGTAQRAAALRDSELRDRFLLAEAAIVDRWIAAEMPGLVPALHDARTNALAARPHAGALSPPERALEADLVAVLADRIAALGSLAHAQTPDDAWRWARGATRGVSESKGYRAIAPVFHWGRVLDPAGAPLPGTLPIALDDSARPKRPPRVAEMPRRPRPREAAEDEDDPSPGTWIIRPDEPQESVEDPIGLQRPTDRDEDADPDGLGDSLSELPDARVVRTPGQPREVLRSGDAVPRAPAPEQATSTTAATAYPEWDYRIGQYRHPGAIVREPEAAAGDLGWARAALSRHGRLVRRVRVRFERLRPRHLRLGRQNVGDELDIDACVLAAADRRAGGIVDGRRYVARRPVRRALTVGLLVDVSMSTDGWVSAQRRIVDVEKEALLVVCEALDALGDPYGIFAFSGESADHVSVLTLKAFAERNGEMVRRRIAALDCDRYTRIGAAVRHVTAALGRQPTRQRLLLILSDGKPNDVDLYEGRYGVEDARQAVAEAKRQGVHVFCLTIDREAPRYAVRVFGANGFAVLHRAEQLPSVLIEAIRQLIRS
jgi:nitric oxide reductase NorD protein